MTDQLKNTECFMWPLIWPNDALITPASSQIHAPHFTRKGTGSGTRPRAKELLASLYGMGAEDIMVTVSASIGAGGFPLEGQNKDDASGVAAYFTHESRYHVIHCDKYVTLRENMRALTITINAIKTVIKHGNVNTARKILIGFARFKATQDKRSGRCTVPPLIGGSNGWVAKPMYNTGVTTTLGIMPSEHHNAAFMATLTDQYVIRTSVEHYRHINKEWN